MDGAQQDDDGLLLLGALPCCFLLVKCREATSRTLRCSWLIGEAISGSNPHAVKMGTMKGLNMVLSGHPSARSQCSLEDFRACLCVLCQRFKQCPSHLMSVDVQETASAGGRRAKRASKDKRRTKKRTQTLHEFGTRVGIESDDGSDAEGGKFSFAQGVSDGQQLIPGREHAVCPDCSIRLVLLAHHIEYLRSWYVDEPRLVFDMSSALMCPHHVTSDFLLHRCNYPTQCLAQLHTCIDASFDGSQLEDQTSSEEEENEDSNSDVDAEDLISQPDGGHGSDTQTHKGHGSRKLARKDSGQPRRKSKRFHAVEAEANQQLQTFYCYGVAVLSKFLTCCKGTV